MRHLNGGYCYISMNKLYLAYHVYSEKKIAWNKRNKKKRFMGFLTLLSLIWMLFSCPLKLGMLRPCFLCSFSLLFFSFCFLLCPPQYFFSIFSFHIVWFWQVLSLNGHFFPLFSCFLVWHVLGLVGPLFLLLCSYLIELYAV